jgi:hypothetical protein
MFGKQFEHTNSDPRIILHQTRVLYRRQIILGTSGTSKQHSREWLGVTERLAQRPRRLLPHHTWRVAQLVTLDHSIA